MISAETIALIVLGILMGISDWRQRRREKKVVAAASDVRTETTEQTTMLKDIAHDLRNVRNSQGGVVESLGFVQRDLHEMKDGQAGMQRELGGLKTSVDALQVGHAKHGERIGELEKHIRKEA